MRAVIDRFEEDYAVILFGDEEIQVNMPIKLLPDCVEEGSWLKVTFELDEEGTENQKKKIQDLLDKLLDKPR